MSQITEQEVAQLITDLINKNVNRLKNDDEKWKNHYESVMQELEHEIIHTEGLIEDFTEDKLPINKIEQEGYLRCLKHIVSKFRAWQEDL